jgi:hypothetical protein
VTSASQPQEVTDLSEDGMFRNPHQRYRELRELHPLSLARIDIWG